MGKLKKVILYTITWIAIFTLAGSALYVVGDNADHPIAVIPAVISSAWLILFFKVNEDYFDEKFD